MPLYLRVQQHFEFVFFFLICVCWNTCIVLIMNVCVREEIFYISLYYLELVNVLFVLFHVFKPYLWIELKY